MSAASGQTAQDKALDAAIVAILAKVGDVKGSLSSFVGKMEHETLTWPSVLDSFSALSGHYSTLMKQLSNEKIPPLHSQVLLPHQVSSEKDNELERSTEGRVSILHHEVVPDYMRTKLELDLEAKQRDLHAVAASPPQGFEETLTKFNSLVDKAASLVEESRENWEKQSKKLDTMQVNTSEETRRLVAAYLSGTGLQTMSQGRKLALQGGKPSLSQQQLQHQQQQQQQQHAMQMQQQQMMQQHMAARTISRVAPPAGMRPMMMGPGPGPPPVPPGFHQGSPYKRQ